MQLSLKIEKSLYDQGFRYDVIYYCRKVPSRIRVSTMYLNAKTIEGAKKTISWLRKCGNYGDYEVREHIYPWDSIITKIKKKLRGVIYYESDVENERSAYKEELAKIKNEIKLGE